MTDEQRKLAYGLVLMPNGRREVSPEDFARQFPAALEEGHLALTQLEEAARAEHRGDLEAVLVVGWVFGFTAAHVPILCQLLGEDWHHEHEDIVLTLQRLKDPRAVEPLFAAAFVSHPYLEYDEVFSLASKCTWALADIGTPDAFAKLELMAAATNPMIAKYAQRRIDRWDEERDRKGAGRADASDSTGAAP